MFDQIKYFFVPREGWKATGKKIIMLAPAMGAAVYLWVKKGKKLLRGKR